MQVEHPTTASPGRLRARALLGGDGVRGRQEVGAIQGALRAGPAAGTTQPRGASAAGGGHSPGGTGTGSLRPHRVSRPPHSRALRRFRLQAVARTVLRQPGSCRRGQSADDGLWRPREAISLQRSAIGPRHSCAAPAEACGKGTALVEACGEGCRPCCSLRGRAGRQPRLAGITSRVRPRSPRPLLGGATQARTRMRVRPHVRGYGPRTYEAHSYSANQLHRHVGTHAGRRHALA